MLLKVNLQMGSVILAQVCGSSLCSPVQCSLESRFNECLCILLNIKQWTWLLNGLREVTESLVWTLQQHSWLCVTGAGSTSRCGDGGNGTEDGSQNSILMGG